MIEIIKIDCGDCPLNTSTECLEPFAPCPLEGSHE
jgi:hypothetical protein